MKSSCLFLQNHSWCLASATVSHNHSGEDNIWFQFLAKVKKDCINKHDILIQCHSDHPTYSNTSLLESNWTTATEENCPDEASLFIWLSPASMLYLCLHHHVQLCLFYPKHSAAPQRHKDFLFVSARKLFIRAIEAICSPRARDTGSRQSLHMWACTAVGGTNHTAEALESHNFTA